MPSVLWATSSCRSLGGSAAPRWYAAGQVDLGTPWSGLQGDGGVDRSGDERGHGPGCRFRAARRRPEEDDQRNRAGSGEQAETSGEPAVAGSFPCGGLQQSAHCSRALRRAARASRAAGLPRGCPLVMRHAALVGERAAHWSARLPSAPPLRSRCTPGGCDWFTTIAPIRRKTLSVWAEGIAALACRTTYPGRAGHRGGRYPSIRTARVARRSQAERQHRA